MSERKDKEREPQPPADAPAQTPPEQRQNLLDRFAPLPPAEPRRASSVEPPAPSAPPAPRTPPASAALPTETLRTPPASATPPAPPTQMQPETESDSQSQAKLDIAERDPLSIVVLDTPAAEPEVEPEIEIEVPVKVPPRPQPTVTEPIERPRVPYYYWALVAIAVALVLHTYNYIFAPIVTRAEDAFERRVLGEKIYEAPKSNPHTTRQKGAPHF